MAKKKLLILDIKKNYDKKFEDYDVAYLSDGEANLKNCHIING